jgi:hypothetical protein
MIPPKWEDGGPILLWKEGKVFQAVLQVDEWFTGEDEIPVPILVGLDWSFYEFDGWKALKEDKGE